MPTITVLAKQTIPNDEAQHSISRREKSKSVLCSYFYLPNKKSDNPHRPATHCLQGYISTARAARNNFDELQHTSPDGQVNFSFAPNYGANLAAT